MTFFRDCGFIFIIFFISFSQCLGGKHNFKGQDPIQIGAQGLEEYESGKYSEASKKLRYALEKEYFVYASAYADICKRELDEEKHTLSESAKWYLVAAKAGDADVCSYLHSLDERLIQFSPEEDVETDIKDKIPLLKQRWYVEDRRENADKGYHYYCQGDYKKASSYLKRAARGNHPLAQQVYADICFRILDERIHPLKEAAMWYLLSAKGGNPESYSYLHSIIPRFLIHGDSNKVMDLITTEWIKENKEKTVSKLGKIKPKTVVDYMVSQHKCDITKTGAMKLPYFFDKVFSALFYSFGLERESCYEEQPLPAPVSDSKAALETSSESMCETKLDWEKVQDDNPLKRAKWCCDEVQVIKSVINERSAVYSYGNVYPSYKDHLDKEYQQDGEKIKCSKIQKIENPILKDLLDAFTDTFRSFNAKKLTYLSHRENPWIVAGIQYWKKHYRKPFTILKGSLRIEGEILHELRNFSEIPKVTLDEILERIDTEKNPNNKDIWPNSKYLDDIARNYQDEVKSYFKSQASIQNPLVQNILKGFYSKSKKRKLDLKENSDKKILETPFLIHLCEELEILNICNDKSHLDSISRASHYFSNLKKLTITSFLKPVQEGLELHRVLRKLAKFGVEINITT